MVFNAKEQELLIINRIYGGDLNGKITGFSII